MREREGGEGGRMKESDKPERMREKLLQECKYIDRMEMAWLV